MEKKAKLPTNTAANGVAFAVTATYGKFSWSNCIGGGHYPMTAVIEIWKKSKPKS